MQLNQNLQMTNKTWGMLILLTTIWGSSFLFGRIAVLEVPAFTVVLLRVGLAAICLWLFILFTKRKFKITKWLLVNGAIIGILNNVIPFSFILYGLLLGLAGLNISSIPTPKLAGKWVYVLIAYVVILTAIFGWMIWSRG